MELYDRTGGKYAQGIIRQLYKPGIRVHNMELKSDEARVEIVKLHIDHHPFVHDPIEEGSYTRWPLQFINNLLCLKPTTWSILVS